MKKLTLVEMQSIAQERGGLCLSKRYVDSKTKLRWRCVRGHEWDAAPSAVKLGSWCRRCSVEINAAKLRITLEEIRSLAKSKGGECLSTQYIGNKNSKLQWQCAQGHVWQASLGKVRNSGSWCPICARLRRSLTLNDMKALAHSKGGECLSDTYHGLRGKLRWRCAKGHEWTAKVDHIRNQGCWCPKCAGRAALTLEDLQSLARSRGGECLHSGPIRSQTKIQWQCAKGHKWMARPGAIKNSGTWCPLCKFEAIAARQLTSIEEIQTLARSRGGLCLSTSYNDPETNLRWQCARGHEWEASLSNVKNNKSWCPTCGAWISERICRGIFEALFQTNFPKVRPDWLKNERGNWMELDGYSKELSIAFEYHGVQHYKFNPFFHGTEELFAQRQHDDQRRAELCREKGVRLFEIPYMIPRDEIENFIREKAATMEILIPRQSRVNLDELSVYENDPLEELRKIANDKGGECLSTAYISTKSNLRWRCSEGHEWEATPHAIKNDRQWCPRCAIKRRSEARRLTIDEMRALARSRGGNFLSSRYQGASIKHRWQCAKGHEWDAKPSKVKHGSWCPECAKSKSKEHIPQKQFIASTPQVD
jgi:hypothetical protein